MDIELSEQITRKYENTYDIEDYEIETDTGWESISSISKTVPYELWEVKTTSFSLKGADNHIVFLENGSEIFLKDLSIGDKIITKNGSEEVIEITNLNEETNMYDISVDSSTHRYFTNGILSHNSTSYTVFCLWYVLSNKDKSILICANKFRTATEILKRIKMAYEELPMWLKPGVVEWNAQSIVFDNGCKISAEATSGNSGRGGSINVLICDEFAFIPPGQSEDFLQSVFPVVSSSKNSKIIIVSTPNGMGNEFYNIWTLAQMNKDPNDKLSWHPVRVDWFDVPGRDENWKKMQLESFGNNMARFNQEYGNDFLGSSETLINADGFTKMQQCYKDSKATEHKIQLHKDYQELSIKMYEPPAARHAYVIGADPSMGTAGDYHAMCVWDITNTFDIKQVAGFYENEVPPKMFAYILVKTAMLYNNACIAIENNGCSQVTLDAIWRDFDYDNIVHEGGNPKTNVGIHSSNQRKTEACLFCKTIFEDPQRKITINDYSLLMEFQKFERKSKIGKLPTYEAADGHDDYVMASIWGLWVMSADLVDRFFDVKKTFTNKLGEVNPLFVFAFDDNGASYDGDYSSQNALIKHQDIDDKMKLFFNEANSKTNKNELTDESMEEFLKTYHLNESSDSSFQSAKAEDSENDDFTFGFFS